MSDRFYTINGKVYPSVTTILNVINKPQIVNWAVRVNLDCIKQQLIALQRSNSLQDLNVKDLLADSITEHDRVKNAAANRGADIHERISTYLNHEADIDYHEDRVLNAFRTW